MNMERKGLTRGNERFITEINPDTTECGDNPNSIGAAYMYRTFRRVVILGKDRPCFFVLPSDEFASCQSDKPNDVADFERRKLRLL
jgi:hypothetical protein